MTTNAMSYIWDEVEAYQKLGEQLYNDIVNAPADYIREIVVALNAQVNGSYPIAREFMDRSINGGGDISYGSGSPVAAAIAASPEFRELVRDMASSSISTQIAFRTDPNLSRSVHDGALSGALEVQGQGYTFTGSLRDIYDFRYDWLPKTWTWRGVGLRLAGNIAKACADVGLMKPYRVEVDLAFAGMK